MDTLTTIEAGFFRMLNGFIEPAVRAGCASPGIVPSGLIVVETTGRRSGLPRRVPVAATLLGEHILISTTRGGRSQWLKNLTAVPAARYWLAGQPHVVQATVFAPDAPAPDSQAVPALLRPLVPALTWLAALGMGFALLTPVAPAT